MATDQGTTYEAVEEEEEKPKKGRGFLPWVIILAIIVLGGLLTAPLDRADHPSRRNAVAGRSNDIGPRVALAGCALGPGRPQNAFDRERCQRGTELFWLNASFATARKARAMASTGY